MPVFVLPGFSLLASFAHNMSKPNSLTFQSKYILKELFFSLFWTVQSHLLFVSLAVADISVIQAEANAVVDWRKSMLFSHLHMAWAEEQVQCQGSIPYSKSQEGQNREAELPLSGHPETVSEMSCPDLSASHTVPGWVLHLLAGSGAKWFYRSISSFIFLIFVSFLFFIITEEADKGLHQSKDY